MSDNLGALPVGDGLSSVGSSQQAVSPLRASIPSADEVVLAIDRGECAWVIQVPEGRRVVPEELWLPDLHSWVKADGFSICGDCARGYAYPDMIGRERIKNAAMRLRMREEDAAQAIETRRAETSGSVEDESAVLKGCAQERATDG